MPIVNGEVQEHGCWIDGHYGQYAQDRVCEIADDLLGVEQYAPEAASLRTRGENGDDTGDSWQALSELADEATDALNEATTGGWWSWEEGELFLNPVQPDDYELSAFIDGYIEAMLWAGCLPTEEEAEIGGYDIGGRTHLEVSLATRGEIVERGQLVEFVTENYDDLCEYVESNLFIARIGTARWSYAGHDHYLTREHHGAGFWDRGLGELGDRLTKASQAYGSADDHTLYDNGDGTAVL